MDAYRLEWDDDLAIIWLDQPDDRMNKLSMDTVDVFDKLLDDILAKDDIKAVIMISAKEDNFIAGADIDMFRKMEKPGDAKQLSQRGNAVLKRIAESPKPFIAAVRGACLGGGLEVALACKWRVIADDPKTVFAFPEVQLGLLPAGGGTQRMPRLIGLQPALDMLLTGKRIYAHKALKLGIADDMIHPHGLLHAAKTFARRMLKKPKPPGRKRGLGERLLENNPIGRAMVFKAAAKQVNKKTRGNYPAPARILKCVKTGLSQGVDAGLAEEAEGFDYLMFTVESRNLVRLFFSMTATKKNPHKEKAREVGALGILGAGLMGAGIAEVTASRNCHIVMKDVTQESLDRGVRQVDKAVRKQVKKRIITSFEADRTMSHLHPTLNDEDLADCDLVIEAVFEDLQLKRKMLATIEATAPSHCIFASNTSSLPIADIAAEAKRPEQVIGMHYFSPVPKMPLLEIIVTDQTADWVLATAMEIGADQGKNMIVVNDGPGFYTSRILAPMLNEAVQLLAEGADIRQVDTVMKDFGFPVGPITLIDEVGIDVGAHVGEVLGPLFEDRGAKPNNFMHKLLEADYKGRKNKRGFYRYDGKKKDVNTDVYQFFGGPERKQFPKDDIRDRLTLAMVNEAAYCLQEDILRNPEDGDTGAVLGLGFPPFLGGPFRYMDQRGVKDVRDRLEQLADQHGPRFKPAQTLTDHVDKRFRD